MVMHTRTGLAATLLTAAGILAAPFLSLALTKEVGGGTVVDARDYPIIFIHGAAGSELDRGGTNLWPGYVGGIINDSGSAQMALNSDGKTDCCGVVTATQVMRYGGGYDMGFVDTRFAPVYQGFYDYMEKEGYGFEKSETGRVFYDFVYDWRKDNRAHTKLLDIKVNQVLKETKAEKVILVGHSMGGLQIRLYMNDEKRAKKVGGVIFLATPHHGAPQVYWAYTYGYNFGNTKVSDTRMWEVMKNWPAGYQLLPDYPAVQDAETGKFWTVEEQMGRSDFISQQEYDHGIAGMGREQKYLPTYGLPNKNFAKDALDFHRSALGDSVKKYPWVKYYMVAGTGQDTVQYFEATYTQRPGFDAPGLILKKIISKNGDGTVPEAGARIDGVDAAVKVVGEHGAIPGTPAAQAYVTEYRKVINDEVFREGLIDKVRRASESRLRQLKSTSESASAEAAADDGSPAAEAFKLAMLFLKGAPDEEKIKKRDDLRRSMYKTFRNANVNIHIQSSGDTAEDSLYATIQAFEFKEIGLGKISNPTVTVEVQGYEVLDGLADGSIDALDAYLDGRVQLKGTGPVSTLKYKIMSWIAKYGFSRR